MTTRYDGHAHFFRPGYVNRLPETCRRVEPDEVTLYEALAKEHDIQQVLAIGYEGDSWALGNNDYLASLASQRSWVRPLAFIRPGDLTLNQLEERQQEGFVGLSLYLFDSSELEKLASVSSDVWAWLESQHWLISVNSRGEHWLSWRPLLLHHPHLRLLISHLGLPPAVSSPLPILEAAQALAPVESLADFPGVHVKLSGFYALTEPTYAYPHRAVWPYVQALMDAFGVQRLIWGSDFAPSLEWVSFPQTFALFAEMPFWDEETIDAITGRNLENLLRDI